MLSGTRRRRCTGQRATTPANTGLYAGLRSTAAGPTSTRRSPNGTFNRPCIRRGVGFSSSGSSQSWCSPGALDAEGRLTLIEHGSERVRGAGEPRGRGRRGRAGIAASPNRPWPPRCGRGRSGRSSTRCGGPDRLPTEHHGPAAPLSDRGDTSKSTTSCPAGRTRRRPGRSPPRRAPLARRARPRSESAPRPEVDLGQDHDEDAGTGNISANRSRR